MINGGCSGRRFDESRARVSQGWPVEKGQQYAEPDSVMIGRPWLLRKQASRVSGPDRMILNGAHIVLVEPVRADSVVAKLIEDLRKQP